MLWRLAPHIIWPMRFVLPHHRALRPRWLLRIGLFLYDHLGGKLLPGSRGLDLTADAAGECSSAGMMRSQSVCVVSRASAESVSGQGPPGFHSFMSCGSVP